MCVAGVERDEKRVERRWATGKRMDRGQAENKTQTGDVREDKEQHVWVPNRKTEKAPQQGR